MVYTNAFRFHLSKQGNFRIYTEQELITQKIIFLYYITNFLSVKGTLAFIIKKVPFFFLQLPWDTFAALALAQIGDTVGRVF